MSIKYYKAFNPSLRHKISIKYKIKNNFIYTGNLNKANIKFTKLINSIKYKNKKIYRKINYYYYFNNYYGKKNMIIKFLILNLLYDPNRNNIVSLGIYLNGILKGHYKYMTQSKNIKLYDIISIGLKTNILEGNSMMFKYIPLNYNIFNVEICNIIKFIRSAGTFGSVINKKNNLIYIQLPSKKIIILNEKYFATLGRNNNINYSLINKGKAGYKFSKNLIKVRGVAKNACDHPHGGGEGKSYVGCKYSMTPWNKKALGKKTRNNEI